MEEHSQTVGYSKDNPIGYIPASIHLIAFNYNSMDFLEGFVKSLEDQDLDRFDITFINMSGTNDGSWEKIKNWVPRPGIVSRKGKESKNSPFDALNTAAAITLSKNPEAYICPINISDRFTKFGLNFMWLLTQRSPKVDVFYPNFKIVDDKEYKNIVGYQNWPEYSHENLLIENMCGCSPLIKGSAFVEANSYNPEYKYTADYDLFLRMALDGKKFQLVEEVIGSHYEGDTPIEIVTKYNEELTYLRQLHTPYKYEEQT